MWKVKHEPKIQLSPSLSSYINFARFIILILLLCIINVSSNQPNPYKILGVDKHTSQDDIRKMYKKLCLKYHPDKNINRTDEERERCEIAFKKVQEANSLIGTSEARKQYDATSYFQNRQGMGSYRSNTNDGMFNQQSYQGYYDPYGRSQRGSSSTYRRRFYVNGIDVSHLFNMNNDSGGGSFFPNPFFDTSRSENGVNTHSSNENSPKSVFVQKVTVSLEDLYSGVNNKEFQVKDGPFQTYRAAFRGGIAAQICLQGLVTSAPLLLRTSWPVSLMAFLITCHISLPRPSKLFYFTSIKRGWKSGTKLIFKQPGIDVVFELKEGKHDRFKREGNDLKTTVTIGRSKARKGCTILIDPLGYNELPIMVKLSRGDVTGNKHVIEVKGRGWPKSDGSRGSLYVTVNVVSDSRAKKLNKA